MYQFELLIMNVERRLEKTGDALIAGRWITRHGNDETKRSHKAMCRKEQQRESEWGGPVIT
jgi:hypothetical protein